MVSAAISVIMSVKRKDLCWSISEQHMIGGSQSKGWIVTRSDNRGRRGFGYNHSSLGRDSIILKWHVKGNGTEIHWMA